MKFYRIYALIERDMRKFFRSPALMMSSMIFPLLQLVVLGYAFGGQIRGVKIAVVDNDHQDQARVVRQHLDAVEANAGTFRVMDYNSLSDAVIDLRTGFVRAVVYIPPDYSRRIEHGDNPKLVFVEDNTDTFVTSEVAERIQSLTQDLNAPPKPPRLPQQVGLQVVELYPYIAYIKYLLAGSISLSIFVVAMIGGGIVFIDDKARGLHEGYLVTPVHKSELVLGLVLSGAIKGMMAGLTIAIIGGMFAGIERLWDPMRLLYILLVVTAGSLTMISFMFLVMVRVNDPLVPRAIFGVLNTLLFFPSGAIYPVEGFPFWLRWLSRVDPFTYTVHALKNLLLKNTGIAGIYSDLLVLSGFAVAFIVASIALFKRQI
ncbi:MAG: ABC transporter permease [Candidatus Acidiferrales bacterium]|jgi:ABC-2 type transport system permease protein